MRNTRKRHVSGIFTLKFKNPFILIQFQPYNQSCPSSTIKTQNTHDFTCSGKDSKQIQFKSIGIQHFERKRNIFIHKQFIFYSRTDSTQIQHNTNNHYGVIHPFTYTIVQSSQSQAVQFKSIDSDVLSLFLNQFNSILCLFSFILFSCSTQFRNRDC